MINCVERPMSDNSFDFNKLEETATCFILRKNSADIIQQIMNEHRINKSLAINVLISMGIDQYKAKQ